MIDKCQSKLYDQQLSAWSIFNAQGWSNLSARQHAAYRIAWFRAFGVLPEIKDSRAYFPMERWNVRILVGHELTHFRSQFDQEFWSTIPPIEGAVEACHRFVELGYELVCVSAIESMYEAARLDNLKFHGFPISRVIATSSEVQIESPKAKSLRKLNAVAFVDDYAPYMKGIGQNIHKALILRASKGSPNVGENLKFADTTHTSLLTFCDWWTGR